MKQDTVRGHLDGLVLAALASGPARGYALIELLRERSGGFFELPEGSVYPGTALSGPGWWKAAGLRSGDVGGVSMS